MGVAEGFAGVFDLGGGGAGLAGVVVRFRSGFAYVDGRIGEEVTPLFRLRYAGSASRWGFANPSRFATIYRQAYGQSPRTTLHA